MGASISCRSARRRRSCAQAQKERSLARVGELLELARQLDEASLHRLRHRLAYCLLESGATPAYVKAILGHRRVSTSSTELASFMVKLC